MVHAPQRMVRICHHLMAALPLDVGDQSHAATVMLAGRIVEAL